MSASLPAAASATALLDLSGDTTWATRHRMALRDLSAGLRLHRLCWMLAWFDIKLRYRGSIIGPFWLTLSTAVMVAAMGSIYATLFHMNLKEYLPFLVLSLVLWGYVNGVVGEGCTSFVQSDALIRSERMPFTVYAARIVLRNLLILAHNMVVIVAVFAILGTWPGAAGLLAAPALLLWLIDGLALAFFLGALCARFRDIPPIVNSVMQMAFFVTPIIWKPELVGPERAWLLPLNPLFSLLDVVRGPLLGSVPTVAVYVSAIGYSALICAVTWLFFARVRGRVAFWV